MTASKGHMRAALMITTAMGVFLPLLASAQEAAPAADEGIQEVVVTASKRETRLLKTPLAVSAFTQDALNKQGIQDVRGLATTIPNLQLGTGTDSGTAISIRGVTSTDFTEVAEGAVSIHQDGFYSPRPQGALALMYDVDRVEVLRGPQGTLFGMNSPGGAINIIPAKPKFGQSYGSAEAELGNYGTREFRGMYNFGISDTFALRATFMTSHHDAYSRQVQDFTDIASPANGIVADGIPDVDQRYNKPVSRSDAYNNQEQWAARVIGRWQATENLEIVGTLSRFADNGAGDHDFVDCEQTAGTPAACDHELRYLKINVPGVTRMTLDDVQFKATYDLSDSNVLEYRVGFQDQRRYQMVDNDGGAHAPAEWSSIGVPQTPEQELTGYYPIWDDTSETKSSNYRSITHELQLKSKGDTRLNYVLGAFYLYEDKQIRYDQNFIANKSYYEDPDLPLGFRPDGLPAGVAYDQVKRTTQSSALFGQFDYKLTETVSVTAGYRYSWDKKTDQNGITYALWDPDVAWYNGQYTPTGIRAHQSDNLTWDMGTNAELGTNMPASEPNNVDMSWKQGTYRFGLQYNPNSNTMFFASVATGYKMGGMYEKYDFCNNGCIELLTYGPEHVRTIEGGYKGKLFHNRLALSVTAFTSDYDDMQNTGDKVVGTDTNPTSPNFGEPVTAWTTDNLSKSKISGLEVEFDAKPWANGQFSGYLAYLKTEIVDQGSFQDGYACAEREIFGQDVCGTGDAASIDGNQLPFAPEFAITLNYQHNIMLSSGYELQPYVSVHWQDRMWLDVQNYDGAHLSQAQDAYTKIDINLRINTPGGKLFYEVFGKNLTDVDTRNFGGFSHGAVRGSYDPPRTWGVRLGYDF